MYSTIVNTMGSQVGKASGNENVVRPFRP